MAPAKYAQMRFEISKGPGWREWIPALTNAVVDGHDSVRRVCFGLHLDTRPKRPRGIPGEYWVALTGFRLTEYKDGAFHFHGRVTVGPSRYANAGLGIGTEVSGFYDVNRRRGFLELGFPALAASARYDVDDVDGGRVLCLSADFVGFDVFSGLQVTGVRENQTWSRCDKCQELEGPGRVGTKCDHLHCGGMLVSARQLGGPLDRLERETHKCPRCGETSYK